MSIKTILFDLDGTLVDTNELIHSSFVYTFEKFGYYFTDEEVKQFNGPLLHDTFRKVNSERADEMIETYVEHNIRHHNSLVKIFPHVKNTLEQLKQREMKMAIVSAKMRKGVLRSLEWTNIASYFDTIISADDIINPKPHPEPVLKAMKALNGDPETSIMIGDSYQDIESGKNAGIKTAGVAWSGKGKTFMESLQPTYMLEDMSDLLRIVGE